MSSLEGEKKAKQNVTMLTTIHEAVMVKTGKTDFFGNKVVKPEAVYYYCGRMGGVDLSDQLLNYYSFLRKSTKWSRKLLIHQLNLLILNAYILNKNYGCEKLSHDEYRDRIVKYLLGEGLKNYNIPLPPVSSKRSENTMQLNMIRPVCVRGISQVQSLKERVKKEKGLPGAVLFVAISLAISSNRKEHLIGVKNVENRYVLSLASKFTTQKGI